MRRLVPAHGSLIATSVSEKVCVVQDGAAASAPHFDDGAVASAFRCQDGVAALASCWEDGAVALASCWEDGAVALASCWEDGAVALASCWDDGAVALASCWEDGAVALASCWEDGAAASKAWAPVAESTVGYSDCVHTGCDMRCVTACVPLATQRYWHNTQRATCRFFTLSDAWSFSALTSKNPPLEKKKILTPTSTKRPCVSADRKGFSHWVTRGHFMG